MTSGSVSMDIFEAFGETIESFRSRQNTVVELIWRYQIENDGLDDDEGMVTTISLFGQFTDLNSSRCEGPQQMVGSARPGFGHLD